MRRRWLPAAVAIVFAVLGCGEDDEVIFGSDGGASSASSASSSSGTGGSSSSSGVGGPDGIVVYGVGNVDDDDLSGQADWSDGWVEADNDLATLLLPASFAGEVQPGDSLALTLSGDVDAIRVWRDGVPLLGPDPSSGLVTSATLPGSAASEALQIEFADFRRAGNLHIRHLAEGSSEVAAIDVPLLSSPLLLAHHLQPAERVWVVASGGTEAVVQGFQSVLGSMVTVVNNPDRWIQDELEWGAATAPGMRLDVAIDSIRDRELDAWVKSLKAPDVQPITWGVAGTDTTEDKFGNLETAPPSGDFPLGRIYIGATDLVGPTQVLQDFLDAQQVQAPLRLDVDWLCIGHVDEYLAFIPDPSSSKGFKLLYADVDAAYAVLDGLSPSMAIPRYGPSHGYDTVGALVSDASLRALNEEIQTDHLDPTLAQLKAELGLDESDVVRVPSLFERLSNCYYSSAWLEAAALIPALVNLTVVNLEGGPIHLFLPDPFLRSNLGDQGSDPIIAALVAALPPGYELHFLDDWYSYHLANGEVHCGSNVMRTPTPPWWETATHLLGGP